MRFIAANIRVPLDAMLPGADKLLRRVVAKAVGVKPGQLRNLRIERRSVDARKKSDVHYVLTVTFTCDDAARGAAATRPAKGTGVC